MTHQATAVLINFTHAARCSEYFVLTLAFSCFFDGRTDTMYKNNDHLISRGLLGQ